MAHAQSAMPLLLPRDFASTACELIGANTETAKLGDLSKFGSLDGRGVSSADTNSDCLETSASRQVSQITSSDASSLEERGMELQKGDIMPIVQSVVKNSVHAASLMDPTDPDERLLAVSESFQAITGYNESELLQASPRLLTAGCEYGTTLEMQALIKNAHLTGSPLFARVVNRSKQGWLFWSTVYIRGLMVAVDPVSAEPVWLVLTTYSSSERPSDEDGEDRTGTPATPCASCVAPARTSAPRSATSSPGSPAESAGRRRSRRAPRWAAAACCGVAGPGWTSSGGARGRWAECCAKVLVLASSYAAARAKLVLRALLGSRCFLPRARPRRELLELPLAQGAPPLVAPFWSPSQT
ncbi:unnamed protein product [Prorocentrum cordatum]|uniref:PAS domain-containing protein n=1 Tax=Prorocentrum cordatum TaxID=2364126 RepID=A0ABN9PVP6_9DINO|nr:unnamed protein product [Polarella glacialis]